MIQYIRSRGRSTNDSNHDTCTNNTDTINSNHNCCAPVIMDMRYYALLIPVLSNAIVLTIVIIGAEGEVRMMI